MYDRLTTKNDDVKIIWLS